LPDAPVFRRKGGEVLALEARMRPTPNPTTELDLCADCGRRFVVPAAILEVVPDNRHYVVELQCNNCAWTAVGTFDEDTMESMDRALDRSQAELARAERELYRENMLAEIDRFAAALAADLILPEDF
jgi:hypothetical protein